MYSHEAKLEGRMAIRLLLHRVGVSNVFMFFCFNSCFGFCPVLPCYTTFEHKPCSRFHYRFIKVQNFQLTSSLSYETPAAIGFDALLAIVLYTEFLIFNSLFMFIILEDILFIVYAIVSLYSGS